MKRKHTITTKSDLNQGTMVFGLASYILRALLKNRSSFFFGLIFPIIIVSVFGAFGSTGNRTKIGIDPAIPSGNPIVASLQKISTGTDAPVELENGTLDDLTSQVSKNKIDGLLKQGERGELVLETSNTNPQGSGTAAAFIENITDKVNLAATGQPPVVTIAREEVSGKSFRYIDFILPGQIGFSLLSVAIFGVAFSFVTLRKTLVLKRIFATSVKPLTFVVAQALARSVQGVLQALILIGFGALAFHFKLVNGGWTLLEVCVLSFLGVLTFIGFGIFFANVARDEQVLPIYLNLFNLPQLFLSGVFFSNDLLPNWLAKIGNNLPLSYVTIAMRKITTEGAPIKDILPYLAGMAVWAVVSYILAARTFKTEY